MDSIVTIEKYAERTCNEIQLSKIEINKQAKNNVA